MQVEVSKYNMVNKRVMDYVMSKKNNIKGTNVAETKSKVSE